MGLTPKRTVQVERSADEREMRKCLGKVSEGFAAGPDLFGVETEVVGIAEHFFEH